MSTTYIINRLLSRFLKNKAPYEVLLGCKPQYDHMRVFGAYFMQKKIKLPKTSLKKGEGMRVFEISSKTKGLQNV